MRRMQKRPPATDEQIRQALAVVLARAGSDEERAKRLCRLERFTPDNNWLCTVLRDAGHGRPHVATVSRVCREMAEELRA